VEGRSFAEFVELCQLLELTSSRSSKVKAVASFLSTLSPEEARAFAYLLVGRKSGERGRPINVGWSTVQRAISIAEGSATLDLWGKRLGLLEVWNSLEGLSSLEGPGSQEKRVRALASLFVRCTPEEREWLVRVLSGEMRHGVNHGIFLEAIAAMLRKDVEEVRYADMVYSDIGKLAELAVRNELQAPVVEPMNPVRPMLAEMCGSPAEALAEHGGRSFFEPKYDGVRLQVHILGGEVRLFTRRLRDVTSKLPDVVESVRREIRCESAVLDSEAIAIGPDGRPMPFQETMRRVGRERELEETLRELPLVLRVFDILHLNGRSTVHLPYAERRSLLESIIPEWMLTPTQELSEPREVEALMRKSVDEGNEGLLAKSPGSPYIPGRRGKHWLKLKRSETLDVVIVAAEWGHGRRSGWLSNYHLAVYDATSGAFMTVGKTFKGLTDEEFEAMTRRLLSIAVEQRPWGVIVRPEVVVEVAFDEVQRSPRYEGGLALRLARIMRIRDDKPVTEICTLDELRNVYARQMERRSYSDRLAL
jgi:DNA ligase-1